jgi:hypothetical protein
MLSRFERPIPIDGAHGLGLRDRGAQAETMQANCLEARHANSRQRLVVPENEVKRTKILHKSRISDRLPDHEMNIVST